MKPAYRSALLILLSAVPTISYAIAPPPSSSLSYYQRGLSVHGNPAAAAPIIKNDDPFVMQGGMINLAVGLEYGDLDDLFDLINEVGSSVRPPDGGDNGEDNGGGIDIGDIIEQNPELKELVDSVTQEVGIVGGLLGIIASEGYAKANVGLDIPVVLSDNFAGGSWMFKFNSSGSSGAVGIAEDIDFDQTIAEASLKELLAIDESTPSKVFDLSGGVSVNYNKDKSRFKLRFDNDSLLLVKAAKIAKFSLGYSTQVLASDHGELFIGVQPTVYRVGLTNIGAKLGDITDSKALFDNIKNADFDYKTGFDTDLGATWVGEHYQLGVSMFNLFETRYDYPEIDVSGIDSHEVLGELISHKSYKIARQTRLEAAVYTQDRKWSLDLSYDANKVANPTGEQYQWVSLAAGYSSDSWWLPSARVGIDKNLAGSKLTYLNAGVTFAKFVNLAVASTLDTVTIQDNNVMRGLTVSLGVQFDY